MTATQVFLRFIESEYKNADGSIDARKLNIWRFELKHNGISSRRITYAVRARCRTSKNFVDDYLLGNRLTLNGFIRKFFRRRGNWMYDYLYGRNSTETENNLSRRWRKFLLEHINETDDFRKYWIPKRKFNFTWKD